MMRFLNWLRRPGAQVTMIAPLLVVAALGCGRQRPERTQDPAEIEEIRQQHLKQAERERQESS